MPLFPRVIKFFIVTALRANGTGVVGAQVRVLNSTGVDVTTVLLGNVSPLTDANGIVTTLFIGNGPLPAGVYTIQVIASGFSLWSFTTDNTFTGANAFTANLTRPSIATSYELTGPPAGPLSSMVPIVCQVSSANQDFEWEQINATVTHPSGKSSIIQAPVDKATDTATLDIRNRVQLGVRPLLVSDAVISREDTDFSTPITVTFSSLNPEGETAIDEMFTRLVAATLPPEGQFDLAGYATLTNRQWIVPSEPVIAFRGYYRDVMIWLPGSSENQYELLTTYYNGAGNVVGNPTLTLTESDYVQRIRLNTDPVAPVAKSVLIIKLNGVAVTKPLTVLYRD